MTYKFADFDPPKPLPHDYDRQASFASYEQSNPNEPKPAADLDAEFDHIEQALDELGSRLRMLQADDGTMRNKVVALESLMDEVDQHIKDTATAAQQAYVDESKHWANHPEDDLVPEGDGVDDYSALHHANKADASASAASTSETNAASSESNAATSETNAATSETNAAASESKAQEWAEKAEDTEVETGKFSALHHAAKAEEWAAGVNLPAVGAGDAGKMLEVNSAEDGYQFIGKGTAAADVPTNADLRDGVDRGAISTDGLGDALWAKPVISGGPSTATAYLLLARHVTNGDSLSGFLLGRRGRSSGAGDSNVQFRISVVTNGAETRTSGFLEEASVSSGVDSRLVTLTYNAETWVALETAALSNSLHYDHMAFIGHAKSGSADQFTFLDSDQVSSVAAFSSNRTPLFAGRSGDIVESGTNSNGSYVRWENGEQICWDTATVDMTDGASFTSSFPASFNAAPIGWYHSGFNGDTSTGDEHAALYGGRSFTSALRSAMNSSNSWVFPRDSDSSAPTACPITMVAWGFWK